MRSARTLAAFLLFALSTFLAVPSAAQSTSTQSTSTEVPPSSAFEAEQALERALAEQSFEHFSDQELADSADSALRKGKMGRARSLVDELLRRDPESIAGHCLLGMVLHHADANLPRALFHLEHSRKLFERRVSTGEEGFSQWHGLATYELVSVAGSMGRHEDKIRYLQELETLYGIELSADYGWPLMRLRRYDEAREVVQRALVGDDREQQMIARTALCAIEAEQQRRRAGYAACLEAAVLGGTAAGPTVWTNAAEAALGVLRLDEAERHLLEATRRPSTSTVSNPWMDLTQLYTAQGRLTEALDAMRSMTRWRNRQPAAIHEQNRTETELTSAVLLIAAGRGRDAAKTTERALERPDRTGFTSSETEQMEAANAIVDSLAQRLAAEHAAEEASTLPLWRSAALRLEALHHRVAAWRSGRRAAALLADERFLLATLRPYLAGSIEAPEWIKPELVGPLGPGVVEAALEEASRRERAATQDGDEIDASGYFLAYQAEIAFLEGRWDEAIRHVETALETLPGSEILLRARVASRGAGAASKLGRSRLEAEWLDLVLQLDPGAIRRHRLALPVRFEASQSPLARRAVDLLRNSPRLDERADGAFRVRVDGGESGGEACLFGLGETLLSCARIRLRAGDDEADDLARRLALGFHQEVFAPRLDLTQSDLQSLDGSPTAAGGAAGRRRLRSVLDEIQD